MYDQEKVVINFTVDDYMIAIDLAKKRISHNKKNKVRDSIGGSNEITHFKGIMGDIAVGKYLKLPINTKVCSKDGESNRKLIGADVGNYEVRASPYSQIAIYPWDHDDSPYIKVTLNLNKFEATIDGWLLGSEGKARGRWAQISKNKHPAFWISNKHLNKLSTLPKF